LDFFEDDKASLDDARLTQQSLVDTQERLGAVLEALPVGLLIHTAQGILYANAHAAGLLHSTLRSLSGQHFLDHVVPEDGQPVGAAFDRAFAKGTAIHTIECAIRRHDDESRRVVSLILGRLPWPGNQVLQLILQDVTDQKHAEASLRQLTITDELTGAYNRRHAFYEAGLYIDDHGHASLPLSVVMVDIDHFKRINDQYGHATGDAALLSMTRMVQGLLPSFREADSAMFARIGGEEFVVLLPGVGGPRARDIAEHLRRAIGALTVPTSDANIRFTASFGVATYRSTDLDFGGLLRRADAALYAAKAAGRDRIVANVD
jgi:diguanylate cyclase